MERYGDIVKELSEDEKRLLGDERDEIPVKELDIRGAFLRARQRRAAANESQTEIPHLTYQGRAELARVRAEAEEDYSRVERMAEKVADTWLFEEFDLDQE